MSKSLWASALITLLFACCTDVSAYHKFPGHFLLEGGGYQSSQGQSQNIYIEGLIGDRFNVTNRHDTNAVLGLGYLIDGFKRDRYGIDYGINAFYLAKTKVSGTITQEFLFTNLAYKYYIRHLPVYAFVKAYVTPNCYNFAVTIDAGIGPNFMKVNQYSDSSLDGVTLPDNAFEGSYSTVAFSAMAGVGLKFYATNALPMEIGYRFFYLGEGSLTPRTNQILNKLKTGNNTAQALIVTVSI